MAGSLWGESSGDRRAPLQMTCNTGSFSASWSSYSDSVRRLVLILFYIFSYFEESGCSYRWFVGRWSGHGTSGACDWRRNRYVIWILSPSVRNLCWHYNDVIIGAIASQITSLAIVYSTVYSGLYHRKHQSSASLASVRGIHRWPVNSPHKWPVTRRMLPFDDVIMKRARCTNSPRNIRC